jgi:hypothetical protein
VVQEGGGILDREAQAIPRSGVAISRFRFVSTSGSN